MEKSKRKKEIRSSSRPPRSEVDYKDLSVTVGDITLTVPKGLRELVENLTKEILKDAPRNIPRYATNYFKALLSRREEQEKVKKKATANRLAEEKKSSARNAAVLAYDKSDTGSDGANEKQKLALFEQSDISKNVANSDAVKKSHKKGSAIASETSNNIDASDLRKEKKRSLKQDNRSLKQENPPEKEKVKKKATAKKLAKENESSALNAAVLPYDKSITGSDGANEKQKLALFEKSDISINVTDSDTVTKSHKKGSIIVSEASSDIDASDLRKEKMRSLKQENSHKPPEISFSEELDLSRTTKVSCPNSPTISKKDLLDESMNRLSNFPYAKTSNMDTIDEPFIRDELSTRRFSRNYSASENKLNPIYDVSTEEERRASFNKAEKEDAEDVKVKQILAFSQYEDDFDTDDEEIPTPQETKSTLPEKDRQLQKEASDIQPFRSERDHKISLTKAEDLDKHVTPSVLSLSDSMKDFFSEVTPETRMNARSIEPSLDENEVFTIEGISGPQVQHTIYELDGDRLAVANDRNEGRVKEDMITSTSEEELTATIEMMYQNMPNSFDDAKPSTIDIA